MTTPPDHAAGPAAPAEGGPVPGDDGRLRCPWGAVLPLMADYHDTEWGVPVHDEGQLLERLVLEGFQSGLSWRTVLAKRPAFRTAFHGFDPDAVAAMGDDEVAALMAEPAIVRNRAKIEATVANARAVVALRASGGIDAFLWSRRPPPVTAPRVVADLAPTSAASAALAADLRRHGLRFVGPTTAQSLMEAIGMVDAHLVGCHRRGVAAAG